MPYSSLPFLGLNDEKFVHNPVPEPPGRDSGREDTSPVFLGALPLRWLGLVLRNLRTRWALSGGTLRDQEEREFNLLTYYVNSRHML